MNLPGVESAPVSGSEAPSLIVSGTFAAGAADPGAPELGGVVEPPHAATVKIAARATIASRRMMNPPTLVRLAAILSARALSIPFSARDRARDAGPPPPPPRARRRTPRTP